MKIKSKRDKVPTQEGLLTLTVGEVYTVTEYKLIGGHIYIYIQDDLGDNFGIPLSPFLLKYFTIELKELNEKSDI